MEHLIIGAGLSPKNRFLALSFCKGSSNTPHFPSKINKTMLQKIPLHLVLGLLFAAISPEKPSAQENDFFKGHYISTKSDSVPGYFDLDNWKEGTVFFKTTDAPDAPKSKLRPEDVSRVVGENGERLYSRLMKVGERADLIFIKQITGPEIRLYEGVCNKLSLGPVFFVSTIDHPEIIWINRNAIKAPFEAVFPDCAYEKPVFYNRTSIRSMVDHYQKCRFKNGAVDVSREKQVRVAVGLKGIGGTAHQASTFTGGPFSGAYRIEKGKHRFYSGGAKGQFWLSNKVAVELELIYRMESKVNAEIHFVQAPIGMNVNFLNTPDYQLFFSFKGAPMFEAFQKSTSPIKQHYSSSDRFAFIYETGMRRGLGEKSAVEIALFYSWDSIKYVEAPFRVRTHFLGLSLAFTNWVGTRKSK